jgi:ABC-type molybdenum transport system ATPase subunit/photorepair protein PhrA
MRSDARLVTAPHAAVLADRAVPAPVLELKDVTFRRLEREILHGISFTARAGSLS